MAAADTFDDLAVGEPSEALDALAARGLRVDALRELLLPPTTWLRAANARSD